MVVEGIRIAVWLLRERERKKKTLSHVVKWGGKDLRGLHKIKLFKKSELLGKSSLVYSQEKPFGTKCIPKLKELHITKLNGLFQHI